MSSKIGLEIDSERSGYFLIMALVLFQSVLGGAGLSDCCFVAEESKSMPLKLHYTRLLYMFVSRLATLHDVFICISYFVVSCSWGNST